jgi:hypothetical protein
MWKVGRICLVFNFWFILQALATTCACADEAIAIVNQPTSVVVRTGFSYASLTVEVTGTSPVYQWRKNGTPVPGAIYSSLLFGPVRVSELGDYDVVVSNSVGSVTSEVASLTQAPALTITEQPQGFTLPPGETGTLSVTASGFGNLSYTWYRYFPVWSPLATPLSFERIFRPELSLTPTSYYVVVTDASASIFSSPATVAIRLAPEIQQQPQRQVIAQGGTASFSVSAIGTLPLSYQWRRNGVNISGATAATLSGVTELGQYDVVVGNTIGTLISEKADLLRISGTPIILEQPVGSVELTRSSHLFRVRAVAQPAPTYQWYKNGIAIGGETGTELWVHDASVPEVGTYHVVVKSLSQVTSDRVSLAVVAGIGDDYIVRKIAGDSVQFTVGSHGTGLTYRWRRRSTQHPLGREGLIINGRTLSLTKLVAEDADEYLCEVGVIGRKDGHHLLIGPYQLSLTTGVPELSQIELPPGVVGSNYGFALPASDTPGKEAASYSATGLPSGLRFDASQGVPVIYGRPQRSRPEPYEVRLTATNRVGSSSIILPLTVHPFPTAHVGAYEGVVPRNSLLNRELGGMLKLVVATNGVASGKLVGGAIARSFTGFFQTDPVTQLAVGELSIYNSATFQRFLRVVLTPGSQTAECTLIDNGPDQEVTFQIGRTSWTTQSPMPPALVGQFNLALQGMNASDSQPAGSSFVVLKSSAKGTVAWSGKMADGAALVGSGRMSDSHKVAVFSLLNANSASLIGNLSFSGDLVDGTANWMKRPQAKSSFDYTDGFTELGLEVVGARYLKPAGGQLLLGLNPSQSGNLVLQFVDSSLSGDTLAFSVREKHVVPALLASAPYASATMKINPTLGTATGTLVRVDPSVPGSLIKVTRNMPFEALVVERPERACAYGFCRVPDILVGRTPATSPRRSISLQLAKP